jgi:hypothetical protein
MHGFHAKNPCQSARSAESVLPLYPNRNIGVPIHTISEGPLHLSVGLNYHASGIKVAELASWVGLGWNLNFGGQISRTIVGNPDESTRGWVRGGSAFPMEFLVSGGTLADMTAMEDGTDTEPDIFSFSAGNHSGKFYFNAAGGVVVVPKQDVQIISNGTNLNSFTIVTPEGERYIYGVDLNDASIPAAYEIGFNPSIGATRQVWHLVKIEDYTRHYWIKLSYESEGYEYPSLASTTVYQKIALMERSSNSGICLSDSRAASNGDVIESGHEAITTDNQGHRTKVNYAAVQSSKRLSRITTSSGFTELIFGATTQREDLKSGASYFPVILDAHPKRLDYIDIKTSAGDAYTKRFVLNYDYMTDPNCNADKQYAKRLRLLSVKETALNAPTTAPEKELPPYTFDYEGDGTYPNRLSKAVDHWGFYNGQEANNNNSMNIPPPTESCAISLYSSNRESNESMMKKGVLKHIEYPTGGFTDFVFEGNKVKTTDSTKTGLTTLFSSSGPTSECCGVKIKRSNLLSLNFDDVQSNAIHIRLSVTKPPTSSSNSAANICNAMTFKAILKVFDASGAEMGSSELMLTSTENATYKCKDIYLKSIIGVNIVTDCRFELHSWDVFATAEIYKNTYFERDKTVGGLRIQQITSHDGIDATKNLVTTYDYSSATNATLSSGVLMIEPKYTTTSTFSSTQGMEAYEDNGEVIRKMLTPTAPSNLYMYTYMYTASDVPVVPLGDFNGYHINYDRVTEIKTGLGKTVYEFYQEDPNGLSRRIYRNFPYPPAPPRVKTGLSKSVTNLNTANTVVSSVVSEVSTPDYSVVGRPFKVVKNSTRAFDWVLLTEYRLVEPSFARMLRKTEVKDGITTITENEYAYPKMSFPTTTKTTNSDNIVNELNYSYPYALSNGYGVINSNSNVYDYMMMCNLVTPIEIYRKINGTMVEGSKIEFSKDLFQNSRALPNILTPMPFKSHSWKRGTGWELTGEIKEYGQNGAVKRFQAVGSSTEVEYTWNQGVLTQKKFGNLVSQFRYVNTNSPLLESVTDENGITSAFHV